MSTHTNLKMKSELYHYAADVTNVYDGDTMTVDLDMGLGVWRRGQTIRLFKLNTPELKGAEREEGLRVRDFVRELVLDKTILLRTILDKRGEDKTGKFGRLLGVVFVEGEDGEVVNLNELLLAQGMALPLTASGSAVPVTEAAPRDTMPPATIACPYCGETRSVDAQTRTVAQCPNCLDESYPVP